MERSRTSAHKGYPVPEKMGIGKNWTKQEEEYLIENWGTISVPTLAKNLRRSENAIIVKNVDLAWERFWKMEIM